MEALRSLTTEESHKEYTRKRREARKRKECMTRTISLVKFFNDKDQVCDGSEDDKLLKASRENKDLFVVQVCNNFDFDFEKDNFWTYDFEKEPLDETTFQCNQFRSLHISEDRKEICS